MNQFEIVAAELAALGLTITVRPGEYVVNFRGGGDGTAYFTDDLTDASNMAAPSPPLCRKMSRLRDRASAARSGGGR